jgi:hypothetical protein
MTAVSHCGVLTLQTRLAHRLFVSIVLSVDVGCSFLTFAKTEQERLGSLILGVVPEAPGKGIAYNTLVELLVFWRPHAQLPKTVLTNAYEGCHYLGVRFIMPPED